ncbi:MAG: hypothetical protein MJ239_03415 [Bacilli bacterium]|nr:hypothetical protein [Bacilli bacterium]
MKKIKTIMVLSVASVLGVAAVAAMAANEATGVLGESEEIWGHYTSVESTLDTFGSKEFWISCSSYNVRLTAPSSGKIEERGAPSVADIATWKDLDDGRLIAKKNEISGMLTSYDTHCCVLPELTAVSAHNGEIVYTVYNEGGDEVELAEMVQGTYTLKAVVTATKYYEGAEKTATLNVTHEAKTILPDGKIGATVVECDDCGETISTTPMAESQIDKSWGFSVYCSGGTTATGDSIKGEYPEYAGQDRVYRQWNANNSTTNIVLPKVDYKVFNKVSIVLHTNGTGGQFIGFGYGADDDLIEYKNHGWHPTFVLNATYDEVSDAVNATINCNSGAQGSFTFNTSDVISGNQGLTLKFHGGAWRSAVLDNVLLNREKGTMVDVNYSEILGLDKVDQYTNERADSFSRNNVVYGTETFASDKLGITIDNGLSVGIDNSEDIGAIKLGGDQGAVTKANITLPIVDFETIENFTVFFSCNTNNAYIGLDAERSVKTNGDTKSATKSFIRFHHEGGKLYIYLKAAETLSTYVADADVISGQKALKLYVSLPAWNFIDISKIIINDTNDAVSGYSSALSSKLALSDASSPWGAYDGGFWYYGLDTTLRDLTMPKIDFRSCKKLIVTGEFQQGSELGNAADDLIFNASAGGSDEYFTVELTANNGTVEEKITVYSTCAPDADGKVGRASDHTVYQRYSDVVVTKTWTIDDEDVYNGTKSVVTKIGTRVSWNNRLVFTVGNLTLK